MIQPFEISYTKVGKSRKRTRNVIGVLCPTVIAQILGLATPIFIPLGDITIDWSAPESEGYKAMFKLSNFGEYK